MANKDYYGLLGIDKNASESEIKSAFRKKAREFHPDVNKDPGAQDKFKDLNEAYQVLSDPQKKSQYDQFGSVDGFNFGGQGGAGFSNFGDIFSGFGDIFEDFGMGFGDIFGGSRGSSRGGRATQTKRRGEDIRTDVTITLEEAAKGVEKEVSVRSLAECGVCNGTGSKGKKAAESCSTCGGRGEVRQTRQSILGTISTVTPCPSCHGEGQTIKDPCPTCSGSGRAPKTRNLKVKIPAGVDSGAKLRVSGEGNAGSRGGGTGDLYVFISVRDHANFERQNDDIFSKHKISISQAALGAEIDVETLHGKIKLKIPAGTQSNTSFRLKGKGIEHLQGYGVGDHYVVATVETPKNLTNEEKTIYEYLAHLRNEKTLYSKGNHILQKIKKIFK